jgi:ribose 5-phosphate isomerase A
MHALAPVKLRDAPPSPDGNAIADYSGAIEDPERLATRLSSIPGVVEHGLFPPSLVSEIFVGGPEGVQRLAGAKLRT